MSEARSTRRSERRCAKCRTLQQVFYKLACNRLAEWKAAVRAGALVPAMQAEAAGARVARVVVVATALSQRTPLHCRHASYYDDPEK
jgi:hypothetical protein